MSFVSGSCFILTCYETVHRTVSAKFINEFGASCLLCFAQFTPPSKRRKAPKIAWTRCPSYFSIPPSATSCTHRLTCRFGRCFCTLCRGLHRRPAPLNTLRVPRSLNHFTQCQNKNGHLSVTVFDLAGAEGLEPSARGFGDRCSTN